MTESRLSITSMSYENKEDIRILASCLSGWFSNPKILHFTASSIRYPFKIQQWINQSYLNQSNTLVLKLDNWIIGHLSIRFNYHKKSAHIFHLIIDPNQQKNGFGKKLIQYAEKLIFENDFKAITLNVLKNNQIAISFFEKNGYNIIVKKKSKKIKMLKYL
tara:strand:+ start:83 stop:565 length:483 start_codon:yes stop_codon:yes gene_type:complete